MVFGPVVGLATTTTPTSISLATGVSSRSRSGAVEPGRFGLISSAPVAPMPSVSPSGGDFASASSPSEPPAPVLFSMTTVLPIAAPSPLPIARAMPSAEAPGANGTMMRMVFCDCASAGPDSTSIASKTARLNSISPSRHAAAWAILHQPFE